VVNVSSSGLLTINAIGSATITVTTVDGGRTATCEVTAGSSCQNPIEGGYSGPLVWILCANGTLTVSGNGAMPNYYPNTFVHPWYRYRYYFSIAEINEGVTSISQFAFYDCQNLVTVTIPNSVTNIDIQAFWNCVGLQSITIPDKVTNIGCFAFAECRKLKSITIPKSVTKIGMGYDGYYGNTFANCSSLTSVTVQWATPPSINASEFTGVSLGNATLHVPIGTKALYQAAPVWKNFGTIVEDVTLTSGVADENEITGTDDIENTSVQVSVRGNQLYVTGEAAERIDVYSFVGVHLFSAVKAEGTATFMIGNFHEKTLIVRGSSGWVRKIVTNYLIY
jgi:hypothetical protein